MLRKTALMAFAIIALVFGAFSAPAFAQDATETPTVTPTPVNCNVGEYQAGILGCIAYPEGGLGTGEARPTPTAIPQPTATPVVTADDAAATDSGSGGASIAFTGSESRVLGYVGAGMIGFGAIALAAARRRSDA